MVNPKKEMGIYPNDSTLGSRDLFQLKHKTSFPLIYNMGGGACICYVIQS